MIRKPGDLPDLAEQSFFAIGSVSGSGWVSNENPRSNLVQSLSRNGDGDFSFGIRKFQSAAPAL